MEDMMDANQPDQPVMEKSQPKKEISKKREVKKEDPKPLTKTQKPSAAPNFQWQQSDKEPLKKEIKEEIIPEQKALPKKEVIQAAPAIKVIEKVAETPAPVQKTSEMNQKLEASQQVWMALEKFPHLVKALRLKDSKDSSWLLASINKNLGLESEFIVFNKDGQITSFGSLDNQSRAHGILVELPAKKDGHLSLQIFKNGKLQSRLLYKEAKPIFMSRPSLDSKTIELFQSNENQELQKIKLAALPHDLKTVSLDENEQNTFKTSKDIAYRAVKDGEIEAYREVIQSTKDYVTSILKKPFRFGKNGPKLDFENKAIESPLLKDSFWMSAGAKYLKIDLSLSTGSEAATPASLPQESYYSPTSGPRVVTVDSYLTKEGQDLLNN